MSFNRLPALLLQLFFVPIILASDLPEGEGRDIVFGTCSACHSIKLVSQNRMPRREWDATITWMQENHNLWPIPREMRNQILDYLERHFSPSPKEFEDYMDGLGPRNVNPLPV